MRVPAAAGAIMAALSVALSAYAAHAADPIARQRLYLAAVFAFGHGVALAALAPASRGWLRGGAIWGLLLGTLLFSGSLAAGQLLQAPTRLAPIGGSLLMLSWLGMAASLARGR